MQTYFPLFVNLDQKRFLYMVQERLQYAVLRGSCALEHLLLSKRRTFKKKYGKLQKHYTTRLFIEQRPYQCDEIQKKGADLVLAATNDKQINEMICIECRRKGIPVNNASDSSQCDFYFPAFVERDGMLIAVISTDGNHKKVAKFSAKLRVD